MSFIKKIISNLLIYKIYDFIKSIFIYRKDYKLVGDTLYSHEFKIVILKYLKCELDKDWIGRLYGIVNPNLDINGNIDISSMTVNDSNFIRDKQSPDSEFEYFSKITQLLRASTIKQDLVFFVKLDLIVKKEIYLI